MCLVVILILTESIQEKQDKVLQDLEMLTVKFLIIILEGCRVRKKTYSQLYQQSRRIMYNAGIQYGLGSARQRNIRDRAKSIMERYGARIDSYFSKRGIDLYGNTPISRRVYMVNANG